MRLLEAYGEWRERMVAQEAQRIGLREHGMPPYLLCEEIWAECIDRALDKLGEGGNDVMARKLGGVGH